MRLRLIVIPCLWVYCALLPRGQIFPYDAGEFPPSSPDPCHLNKCAFDVEFSQLALCMLSSQLNKWVGRVLPHLHGTRESEPPRLVAKSRGPWPWNPLWPTPLGAPGSYAVPALVMCTPWPWTLHPHLWVHFLWFQLPAVNCSQEANDPPPDNCQKVSGA